MNKKIRLYNMKSIFYLLPLWLLLFACTNDQAGIHEENEQIPDGMGAVRLEIKSTTEFDIPTIMTRAVHHFDMDPTTFPLRIYEKGNDGSLTLVKAFDSYEALVDNGLPLQLPVGTYQIVASSFVPAEGEEVTDKVYFEGKSEFIVEEKRVSNVSVNCKYASLAVELRLSEQFQQLLETDPLNYAFEMDVYNGVADAVWSFCQQKIDGQETETKLDTGYFLKGCTSDPGKLIVKVRVRLGSSNKWYPERTYYFDNNGSVPQIGEYYVINLDAGPEAQAAAVKTALVGNYKMEELK